MHGYAVLEPVRQHDFVVCNPEERSVIRSQSWIFFRGGVGGGWMKGGNDSFKIFFWRLQPLFLLPLLRRLCLRKTFFLFFFHPRILLLPRREPNLARGWGHGSGYGRGKRRNHFIRDCTFRWLEAVRVRARRFKVWNWGISRDQVYLFGRNH